MQSGHGNGLAEGAIGGEIGLHGGQLGAVCVRAARNDPGERGQQGRFLLRLLLDTELVGAAQGVSQRSFRIDRRVLRAGFGCCCRERASVQGFKQEGNCSSVSRWTVKEAMLTGSRPSEWLMMRSMSELVAAL